MGTTIQCSINYGVEREHIIDALHVDGNKTVLDLCKSVLAMENILKLFAGDINDVNAEDFSVFTQSIDPSINQPGTQRALEALVGSFIHEVVSIRFCYNGLFKFAFPVLSYKFKLGTSIDALKSCIDSNDVYEAKFIHSLDNFKHFVFKSTPVSHFFDCQPLIKIYVYNKNNQRVWITTDDQLVLYEQCELLVWFYRFGQSSIPNTPPKIITSANNQSTATSSQSTIDDQWTTSQLDQRLWSMSFRPPSTSDSPSSVSSPTSPSPAKQAVFWRANGACVLTGIKLKCECCHVLPNDDSKRQGSISHANFDRLQTAVCKIKSEAWWNQAITKTTKTFLATFIYTVTTDEVTYSVSLKTTSEADLCVYMFGWFNPLWDNGTMWCEIHDQKLYLFFHTRAYYEYPNLPKEWSSRQIYDFGQPVPGLEPLKPELFEFHRFFHCAVKQMARHWCAEALVNHRDQCKSWDIELNAMDLLLFLGVVQPAHQPVNDHLRHVQYS